MIENLGCCNIYTAETRICVIVQWTTVDHMTLFTSKIKSCWNCRCELTCDGWGNLTHKAGVLPVYIRRTTLQLTLTVFRSKNLKKWDFMFGLKYFWSCNIIRTQCQLGLSHTNFRYADDFVAIVAAAVVGAVVHAGVYLGCSKAKTRCAQTYSTFHCYAESISTLYVLNCAQGT